MIIDQFGLFFDSTALKASAQGKTISVMPYLGRGNPVNVTVLLQGAETGTMNLVLEESSDGATFTEAAQFTMTKDTAASAAFGFALPQSLRGGHVRLSYTFAGTTSGMKIFAGVTRDHFAPYDKGLYIDGGKVVA